jgi:hypothetical protein
MLKLAIFLVATSLCIISSYSWRVSQPIRQTKLHTQLFAQNRGMYVSPYRFSISFSYSTVIPCTFIIDATNFPFKNILTSITVALSLTATAPNLVHAANYGGFGSNYAEVINPKDAVLNDEQKNSEDVKTGRAGVDKLIGVVQALKQDLVS